MQKLVEWLKDHDDALLEDCQLFLKRELGLEISLPTISRQLVKATGKPRTRGRARRVKQRREGTRVELDISLGRRKKDGEEDGEEDDEEEESLEGDSNLDNPNQPPLESPVSVQAPSQHPPPSLQPSYHVHQHQSFRLALPPAMALASRPPPPQVYEAAHGINHEQAFQLPQMLPLIQGQHPAPGSDAPVHHHPGNS